MAEVESGVLIGLVGAGVSGAIAGMTAVLTFCSI